jgi:hypothetical protein
MYALDNIGRPADRPQLPSWLCREYQELCKVDDEMLNDPERLPC